MPIFIRDTEIYITVSGREITIPIYDNEIVFGSSNSPCQYCGKIKHRLCDIHSSIIEYHENLCCYEKYKDRKNALLLFE